MKSLSGKGEVRLSVEQEQIGKSSNLEDGSDMVLQENTLNSSKDQKWMP